jgi:hypothetical protein
MKEDILEQLVDCYLQSKGYFTRHNLKFKPRKDHKDFIVKQDSNHSDIDVIGYNPCLPSPDNIWVVSCKSWQAGFSVNEKIKQIVKNKRLGGKESWRYFRELVVDKWADALIEEVKKATGSKRFTYVTAVTSIKGDRAIWEKEPMFLRKLRKNPIRIISLKDMIDDLTPTLTKTVVPSQFVRTLQLLKAAGFNLKV